MKVWILSVVISACLMNTAIAQEEKPITSQAEKGDTWLTLMLETSHKSQINESFYRSFSVGIGTGYYFIDRIAIKANVLAEHHDAFDLVSPTLQEYDNQNSVSFSGQIRYNFWELPGLGAFLQSGYNYGRFPVNKQLDLKRWEIIYFGQTLYTRKANVRKLGMEVGGGIEKSNLNQKIQFSAFFGFNYYFKKPAKTK